MSTVLDRIPAKPAAAVPRFDATAAAEALAAQLARGAAARDAAGGHPAAEREALRRSGLLLHAVPAAFGGHGGSWPEVLAVVRRIAEVDSAIAHLLGFHHLQLAGLLLQAEP